MKLHPVRNSDGVEAFFSYVVCDGEALYALDIVGAESSVKAIYASIVQGHPVWLFGWRQRRCRIRVRAKKFVLASPPPLLRWHVIPVMSPHDPFAIVYGWGRPEDALARALNRWTVFPLLPAEPLYSLAEEYGLIRFLDYSEGVDYAFSISLSVQEWSEAIDHGIKDGRLPL